jgi:GlpG protein
VSAELFLRANLARRFAVYGIEFTINLEAKMRLIGHLANESTARTFGDYLYVQGIENRVEDQQTDGWAIWVNDEDKLAGAAQLLAQFRANPSDPQFQKQAKNAADLRAEKEKEQEAYQKRLRSRRHLFRPLTGYGFGPLTFVLIVASVVVFILSSFGSNWEAVKVLSMTDWTIEGSYYSYSPGLLEIRNGEIWRLFTPIFIHGNFMHIFFNLWWLRDLGSMIEGRQSSLIFAALVLVIAGTSNLAQYWIAHTAVFGGMSGVVYGLFGYVWVRGKFDPGSGLFVHPINVAIMLIWLVVCYTGLVGPVANTAHLAGLVVGAVWGFLSSLRYR